MEDKATCTICGVTIDTKTEQFGSLTLHDKGPDTVGLAICWADTYQMVGFFSTLGTMTQNGDLAELEKIIHEFQGKETE